MVKVQFCRKNLATLSVVLAVQTIVSDKCRLFQFDVLFYVQFYYYVQYSGTLKG